VRLLKDGVKCQPTVELVPMFVPLVMAQAVVVTIKEEGEEEVELEPTLVTTYIKSYSSKDMFVLHNLHYKHMCHLLHRNHGLNMFL
jgi:hypothetical protein